MPRTRDYFPQGVEAFRRGEPFDDFSHSKEWQAGWKAAARDRRRRARRSTSSRSRPTRTRVDRNPILDRIEKSAFQKGVYVGYADGVWYIRKNGRLGWIANHREHKHSPIRAKTLAEVNARLGTIESERNPRARRRARRRSTSARTRVDRNPRRNRIQVDTITGPSHWASYLINGDASGLTREEKKAADTWLKKLGAWSIVSTADDAEPRFTRHYRLYGGTADGGDVIDYVAHKRRPSALAEVKAFQKRERQKHKAGRIHVRRNPIRKRYVVELLHKNYGLWYLKRADRPGKNTTQRREAAEVFETEKAAGVAMRAAHDAFPARVRRDFVWMRTAVK